MMMMMIIKLFSIPGIKRFQPENLLVLENLLRQKWRQTFQNKGANWLLNVFS